MSTFLGRAINVDVPEEHYETMFSGIRQLNGQNSPAWRAATNWRTAVYRSSPLASRTILRSVSSRWKAGSRLSKEKSVI